MVRLVIWDAIAAIITSLYWNSDNVLPYVVLDDTTQRRNHIILEIQHP